MVLRLCAMAIVIAACGPKPTSTTPGAGGSVLTELAHEIDPGPQAPLWPQVPAEVRTPVEQHAPKTGDALAAARERLANWSAQFSTTDPETLVANLERAFEGVYLAEPLALAAGAPAQPARALLWDFYSTFTQSSTLLRSLSGSWGITDPAFVRTLAVAEQLASGGIKMRDHLAAELLRGGTGPAIDDILWMHAARKRREGNPGARALYAELLRRRADPKTVTAWIEVARARIGLEDPAGAATAIERARPLVPAGDRLSRASVIAIERDIKALRTLLALPTDAAPASQLARFDELLALNRTQEAKAILEPLAKARPKDARVRARSVQLRLSEGDISASLVDSLRGDDLTDRDAMYWSVRIGAAGMAFKVASSKEALDELGTSARELAKLEPGRAAAIGFIMERVVPLTGGGADEKAILKILRDSFDPALALRAKYPEVGDVDRIVLTLALFQLDPAKGFAAAIVHPRVAPEDDPDLYNQRAHVLVTLAAYVGAGADLAAVQLAVEEVPPSDREMEGARAALLGDLEMLRALGGEPAAWPRAMAHWKTATETSQLQAGRLFDNLGYATTLVSGDMPAAQVLFEKSYKARSDRRWVPLLNVATQPTTSTAERLEVIRALADQLAPKTPGLVNAWRASIETDPALAQAAAAKALEDFDATLSFHQISLHARGLATEGAFKIGVGLRSGRRAYDLSASAFATLWLVRPIPVSRGELEKAAKPRVPPKKK
ncbi:MAG: hypothetical protein ABI867_26820 [Kofleriaceae bacterium]